MSQCYLLDLERTIREGITTFWKANKRGYTIFLSEAGLYEQSTAEKIAENDYDKTTVVVEKSTVSRIFK